MARITSIRLPVPGTPEHTRYHTIVSFFFIFLSLFLVGLFLWRTIMTPEDQFAWKLFFLLMVGASLHALCLALDELLDVYKPPPE